MAKRQKPSKKAESRMMAAHDIMSYKPSMTDRLNEHVQKALSGVTSALRSIDEGVAVKELKPHQAAFRGRMKKAIRALMGGENKNGKK